MKLNHLGGVVVLLGLAIWAGGCASGGTKVETADQGQLQDAKPFGRPTADKARVIFLRHSNLVSGIVDFYVVDTGAGNQSNISLLEDDKFSPEKGNFDCGGNARLYRTNPTYGSVLILGVPKRGLLGDGEDVRISNIMTELAHDLIVGLPPTPAGAPFPIISVKFKHNTPLPYNAQVVAAKVGSGATVTWDRPAGTMKLAVISPNGDEAISAPFKLEAGHTYWVDYYYMSAAFRVFAIN